MFYATCTYVSTVNKDVSHKFNQLPLDLNKKMRKAKPLHMFLVHINCTIHTCSNLWSTYVCNEKNMSFWRLWIPNLCGLHTLKVQYFSHHIPHRKSQHNSKFPSCPSDRRVTGAENVNFSSLFLAITTPKVFSSNNLPG